MADAAEEEFNELMRDKERTNAHPEDRDGKPSSDHGEDSDQEDRTKPEHTYKNGDYEDDVDDDDDNYNDAAFFSGAYSHRSTTTDNIPRTRAAANTGPKGVIADAQNYLDSQRANIRANTIVPATSIPGAQTSFATGHLPESEIDALLGGEEGEDDSEFMQEWRQTRLRELQNGSNGRHHHPPPPQNLPSSDHRDRRDLPSWAGGLAKVDGLGFLDALESSPPDVVVIVYIYDDRSEISQVFEQCLRDLAPLHPSTRFIKLHFRDAQMEPAGVPALLAYRNGDKFAGLVPLVDELPDDEDVDLAPETLEKLLKSHHIL